MKHLNDDKQMTDVWRLPAIAPWEKSCGKHPTQKPLSLLTRIILASTDKGAWVLDPFSGSSTTGIAANLIGRRFLGIEKENEFAEISMQRRQEIDDIRIYNEYRGKIKDIARAENGQQALFACEDDKQYGFECKHGYCSAAIPPNGFETDRRKLRKCQTVLKTDVAVCENGF